MKLVFTIAKIFFKLRLRKIESLKKDPIKAQDKVFRQIIKSAKNTEWGKKYNYASIKTISDFQKSVPLSSYEDIFPFISKMMNGEKNILWRGQIKWFAKSSGTTNDRSKFIPVSKESLKKCHLRASADSVLIYTKSNPKTKLFDGKGLIVGGSIKKIKDNPNIFCGDISAIMMSNLSFKAKYLLTPSLQTALLNNYEEKIEKIADEASKKNVVSIAGVPTWMTLIMKRVLEKNNAKNIFEVWPNLEVFFHGAVSFTPYQKLFEEIFPSPEMHYMELYNASEGFFGIQDDLTRKGEMMLMPEHGIFYEFIPINELGSKNPKTLTMSEVKKGENYALAISTNTGLWRYIVGDTVSFTTFFPHRIKITGRTKHFINVFGEEVLVHNTDTAIALTCKKTNSLITEYTVAPIFMQDRKSGSHEWIIEFEKKPESLETFKKILDETLRKLNSDYDAKRFNDIALGGPVINVVPCGTFYRWMKSREKFGGQNKVPRLYNTREYVDGILKMIQ